MNSVQDDKKIVRLTNHQLSCLIGISVNKTQLQGIPNLYLAEPLLFAVPLLWRQPKVENMPKVN